MHFKYYKISRKYGDNTTPITSITPPDLELFKAYPLRHQKATEKVQKQPKYKITIELSGVESDSAEYSAEDELESETEEHTEPEFTDDELQKDTEDVENSLKKSCA